MGSLFLRRIPNYNYQNYHIPKLTCARWPPSSKLFVYNASNYTYLYHKPNCDWSYKTSFASKLRHLVFIAPSALSILYQDGLPKDADSIAAISPHFR